MAFNYPIGSGGKPPKKAPMAATPQAMGGAEEGSMPEEDGAAVAAEHGPAVEVHHQHDHEMGVHHVHSIHGDGHEHHSQHESAEEAIEHHKKLVGGGEHESEHDEEEPWGSEKEE